jgi:hypothetical protein
LVLRDRLVDRVRVGEEVESDKAQEVMKELETAYASPSFVGSTLSATSWLPVPDRRTTNREPSSNVV